ncbi:LPS translocon maturation chaperone LptM [Motiliproteus sp. MSK22-1]|nr:lipoprotein [Motiliproteus sp. MSK22-1]
MNHWFLALILGVLVLTGCGQKGDLYLPDQPQQQQPE